MPYFLEYGDSGLFFFFYEKKRESLKAIREVSEMGGENMIEVSKRIDAIREVSDKVLSYVRNQLCQYRDIGIAGYVRN